MMAPSLSFLFWFPPRHALAARSAKTLTRNPDRESHNQQQKRAAMTCEGGGQAGHKSPDRAGQTRVLKKLARAQEPLTH